MIFMCKLTKNQTKVLELFYKGRNKKQIQRKAGLSPSSVDEALRRGKMNVDRAVETMHVAVEKAESMLEVKAYFLFLNGLTSSKLRVIFSRGTSPELVDPRLSQWGGAESLIG